MVYQGYSYFCFFLDQCHKRQSGNCIVGSWWLQFWTYLALEAPSDWFGLLRAQNWHDLDWIGSYKAGFLGLLVIRSQFCLVGPGLHGGPNWYNRIKILLPSSYGEQILPYLYGCTRWFVGCANYFLTSSIKIKHIMHIIVCVPYLTMYQYLCNADQALRFSLIQSKEMDASEWNFCVVYPFTHIWLSAWRSIKALSGIGCYRKKSIGILELDIEIHTVSWIFCRSRSRSKSPVASVSVLLSFILITTHVFKCSRTYINSENIIISGASCAV